MNQRKNRRKDDKTTRGKRSKKDANKKDAETSKTEKPKSTNKEKQKLLFTSSLDPFEVPLKWWETQHIKYAISHPPVRTRMETLIGTNVVRLTDRKYMTLFASRIKEHHYEEMKKRINDRKEWNRVTYGLRTETLSNIT